MMTKQPARAQSDPVTILKASPSSNDPKQKLARLNLCCVRSNNKTSPWNRNMARTPGAFFMPSLAERFRFNPMTVKKTASRLTSNCDRLLHEGNLDGWQFFVGWEVLVRVRLNDCPAALSS